MHTTTSGGKTHQKEGKMELLNTCQQNMLLDQMQELIG